MVVKFIKETKINQEPFYYTTVNGEIASNSGSPDEIKARQFYNYVVEKKGDLVDVEVLETNTF